MCFASPLDETLDKEVLLMMHGPSPDIMALEFQELLNRLVIGWNELLVTQGHFNHSYTQCNFSKNDFGAYEFA